MKIIAHRGASIQAPENTLAAFRKAWQSQADGIELDVHLSSDNILTVIHDTTTRRTCRKNLRVAQTPFEQLSQLCPAAQHSPTYSSERIARLEQVFEITPANSTIAIELKPDAPDALQAALQKALASDTCPPHTQLILMSFHQSVMKMITHTFPECIKLWLFDGPADSLEKRLKSSLNPGFDGIGLSSRHPPSPEQARAIRESGQILSVWVENNPEQAKYWQSLGFSYLTTDRPECFDKGIFS